MNFFQKQLIVENDLEWLYHQSDCDLGLRSNYMSMINCALLGPVSGYTDTTSSQQFHAADHKSFLIQVLRKLSPLDHKVLEATYAVAKYPAPIERIFGQTTGAAFIYSMLSSDKFLNVCNRIHLGTASTAEKTFVSKLRLQAQTAFSTAVNNYLSTKRSFKDD